MLPREHPRPRLTGFSPFRRFPPGSPFEEIIHNHQRHHHHPLVVGNCEENQSPQGLRSSPKRVQIQDYAAHADNYRANQPQQNYRPNRVRLSGRDEEQKIWPNDPEQ